jgi:hypothetical protein
MLHTAFATAPGRPMVHAAAVVAGLALTGAAVAFAAGVITATRAPSLAIAARPPEPRSALPPAPEPAPSPEPPVALVSHATGASRVDLARLPDPDDDAIAVPRPAEPRDVHAFTRDAAPVW